MKTSLRFDSRRWNRLLGITVVAFLVVNVMPYMAFADETVRRVQEELRKRHLYFGDIDGRATPETQAALKRYQERKGFTPTGTADAETAQALGIQIGTPPSPNEAPWPEEPVLRSELARNDRAFLEHSEPAEPIAEHLPTEGPDTTAKEGPESEPETPREPASQPANDSSERVRQALESYITAAQDGDPDAEMIFYADKVNYFDHGVVDRKFIRSDIDRYRQRWPKRDYKVVRVQTRPVPGRSDEVEVRFRLQFAVSNGRNSVRGITENAFRMEMAPEGPRLVALSERRVRN